MIVNGTPQCFFGGSRSLHQGDPLSRLLFVLVMKAFSRMIKELVVNGSIEGFYVGGGGGGRGGVNISHLLFVDDTLILCEADESYFRNLQCLLLCFEAVLRLQINLPKSEAISIDSVGNVQELVVILCCRVSSLPIIFLGFLWVHVLKVFTFGMVPLREL